MMPIGIFRNGTLNKSVITGDGNELCAKLKAALDAQDACFEANLNALFKAPTPPGTYSTQARRLLRVCAVIRRRFPVGANPIRQSLHQTVNVADGSIATNPFGGRAALCPLLLQQRPKMVRRDQ